MVPRGKRATRADFSTGYPQTRVSTEHFSATLKTAESSRFGVVVSKKVLAAATKRNLLRRQVSSILLEAPLPPGALLVYAKKGAGALSYSDLKKELTELLQMSRSR